MKGKTGLASVLLGLAIFGNSHLGLAGSWSPDSGIQLEQLEKEGWQNVSPGVLQRSLEDDKVETLGFGAEGLRFRIEKLKADLAFFRQQYGEHPSRALRRAIRAQRAEILRSEASLRKADAVGALDSASEAMTAWTGDCPANYAASAYAYPLATGAGASASASFKNACGFTGEVYVTTYSAATTVDGKIFTGSMNDPQTAPSTPRVGGDVTAAASIGVSGIQACDSSAYASVTTYDLGITYSVDARNGDPTRKDGKCSGNGIMQPFAADAASNLRFLDVPPVDPNSSAMVANLNSAQHKAHLYEFGKTVYNGSAGSPRTIVCTKTWGTCGVSQMPIHPSWKPASGSEGAMVVIDYPNRKIYNLYQVATNPDGTVMINADGTVTVDALQKYGAYLIGTGGLVFGLKFEVPTDVNVGGSGLDPYPGVGLAGDGYDMLHIPWSRLKVGDDCQCTPY